MRFRNLEINPLKNPAILDTATWDTESALQRIKCLPKQYLNKIRIAADTGQRLPLHDGFTPCIGSLSRKNERVIFLATLGDGQEVFIEIGPQDKMPILGIPVGQISLTDGIRVDIQKTDASVINQFFRDVNPEKGPKVMGAVPRLGIGVRMTTACWHGILKAMCQKGFRSNMIQNSVRELNTMSTLLEGIPAEKNYACGFGTIESGYTGSSFEGLWVSGVVDALKWELNSPPYGADADHIQIKRGPDGITRARRIIDCTRYYTFYTIDVADILDYSALREKSAAVAEDFLIHKIKDKLLRKQILYYHSKARRITGKIYRLDPAAIGRLVGKYWDALDVMEDLTGYINTVRNGQPFDLELAIDEHPPDIHPFDCLSTDEEIVFVLLEANRRGLPITHIAPNFGIEKGKDYRCHDGLEGLEKRVTSLFQIAEEFRVMLDFHSGDDLTSKPRCIIRKATCGRHHFKISPMLQIIFADVLRDFHPDLFSRWWDDAIAYARREASVGSQFAAECIKEYEKNIDQTPSYRNMVFHHYSFAFVGKRDENGQFLYRELFYDLSPAFYEEYRNRLVSYLCRLADELF